MKEAIEYFPEEPNLKVTTPAAIHLFNTNKECQQLNKEMLEIFHSITAKLLYIIKAKTDIVQEAVKVTRITERN